MTGLIGPGRAEHLLDLDLTILLAFFEGVVCENPDNAEEIQKIYDAAKPRPELRGANRRADVNAFMALAG